MSLNIGVIGCGKMAHAILTGLITHREKYNKFMVYDVDPGRCQLFEQDFSAEVTSAKAVIAKSDLIILAVKPAQIEVVLTEVAGIITADKIIVSIAAGIKTTSIEKWITVHCPVIRVMPNTPALVGKGMTAICAGKRTQAEQVSMVFELFETIGSVVVINEKHMDAVTAISGCGPAYFYLIAEVMVNAGVNVGLDANLARQLVLETMQGSVSTMMSADRHPAQLRDDVCSPGGSTITAVRKLEENGIRKAFFDAVEAAWRRSIELGMDK
ncbi:MAG: pyrroline-5-carboxylate reductase [Deltaproteobacteria bacterium]